MSKYYTVVKNEQHYNHVVQKLTNMGYNGAKAPTWKGIRNSYTLEEFPSLVWYDEGQHIEYCYKNWLDAHGYTEKRLDLNIIPEELFQM